MRGEGRTLPPTSGSGSLRDGLQISADTFDGPRPRVTAITEIEDKAWIANDISSETGWGRVTTAQKFFDFPEQIHLSFSLWPHSTRLLINSQRNSYLSRQFPITTKGALMMNDPRLVLERLCVERGEDFAGLSRMLGKNPAYIQQFVRRGVPKRLREDERRKLARYFGIAESLLGGPADEAGAINGLLAVKRHPVMVSAGPGAIVAQAIAGVGKVDEDIVTGVQRRGH